MSQPQEPVDERLGGGQVSALVPIDVKLFEEHFLKPAEAQRRLPQAREEKTPEDIEDLQLVEEIASNIKRLLMSKGHLVISIAGREAFAQDVKRKVMLIHEMIQILIDGALSELRHYYNVYRRAASPEEAAEALERLQKSFKKIVLAPDIFLKVMDDYMGLLQVNLPIDLMPNSVKSHMGFVTS